MNSLGNVHRGGEGRVWVEVDVEVEREKWRCDL